MKRRAERGRQQMVEKACSSGGENGWTRQVNRGGNREGYAQRWL